MVEILVLKLLLSSAFALDANLYHKVDKEVARLGDSAQCQITDKGERTLDLECFIPADAEWDLLKEISLDLKNIGTWLVRDVNRKDFLIQLQNVEFKAPDVFTLKYQTQFAFYKQKSERSFTLRPTTEADQIRYEVDTLPSPDSVIEKTHAFLYFFKNSEDRAYVYLTGSLTFKSDLLYKLIPIRVVQKQMKERVRLIIENYRREESRRRELKKRVRR